MATQDFTTWTENDASGYLTVASGSITWNDLPRSADGHWVYKDFGAAYFNGDLSHTIKFTTPSEAGSDDNTVIYFWLLTNAVNEPNEIDAGGGDFQGVRWAEVSGDPNIVLTLCENGTIAEDSSIDLAWSTTYFLTIIRDDDGGANSTGRYTVRICTTNYYGGAGATLIDTLAKDCKVGEQNDFQYLFASCPEGYATGTLATDGVVADLDMHDEPVYEDMAVSSGLTGGGSATLETGAFVDMAVSSGFTGGGSVSLMSHIQLSGISVSRRIVVAGNNQIWYEVT